jgi:hypothetical protein
VIKNNMTNGKSETEATKGNFSYAKSNNTDEYSSFVDATHVSRNGTSMKTAIAGAINALTGGKDYSNGAKGWDGIDVLQGSPNSKLLSGHNSPDNHYRQRQGGIIDPGGLATTFYQNSLDYVGRNFGVGGREYRSVQQMILGKTVPGKTPYKILSTYGATVFYDRR